MKNLKFLFLFFASVIITITSCKDDDDSSDNNKETINFGIIAPVLMYPEYTQEIIYSAELAVNEINSNGGVLGKELKIVVEDDEGNADISVSKANKLFDENNVVSFSLTSSSRSLEVFDKVMNTKDAIMISPSTTSPELTFLNDKDLVWRTVPSDAFQGRIAANYVKNTLNISEVTTLCVDNTYGKGLTNEFIKQFEEIGGTLNSQFSYESRDSYDDFDFKDDLDLLFENKPEFIYIISQSVIETSKIFTQIKSENYFQDGYKPSIMVGDGAKRDNLFENSSSSISEGVIGTAGSATINEEFNANFKAFSGIELTNNDTKGMYDAIYLMAYAMLSAESSDPNIFKSKMQEVSKDGKVIEINEFAKAKELIEDATDINYDGASGKIDFDENGDVTSGTYEIWKVVNSEFVTVTTIDFP